jgi:histidinol-phosphatase
MVAAPSARADTTRNRSGSARRPTTPLDDLLTASDGNVPTVTESQDFPAADDDLSLALALADAADAISTSRFGALDLRVETKPDATPVTDADKAVERAIRELIDRRRPGDAVVGEEYGESGEGARRWILDPIDGTKNFVRGVPVWATLVALMDADEVYVGVVSAPALGRRWWASRGQGAWMSVFGGEPRRLHVSGVADLADASVSYSSLHGWDAAPGGRAGILELDRRVWRVRGYGDFWQHVMVAEGVVDVATEPEVTLWDLAPLAILVEEAGGTFTDLHDRRGPAGGSALATNGVLHETVLRTLSGEL